VILPHVGPWRHGSGPAGPDPAPGGNVMTVALCTKGCAQRHSHT